ncbi:ComEC/Rec2 family competence protein, partial [Streptomyces sp. T-3]|nr:ComEC/Rec2 family competence protein [Streptomyces sp. T-3]
MRRPAVHEASEHRLGASHPRQEGPPDLRLVPPALAAWGTAAVALGMPARWTTVVVAACVVLALGLLAAEVVRGRRGLVREGDGREGYGGGGDGSARGAGSVGEPVPARGVGPARGPVAAPGLSAPPEPSAPPQTSVAPEPSAPPQTSTPPEASALPTASAPPDASAPQRPSAPPPPPPSAPSARTAPPARMRRAVRGWGRLSMAAAVALLCAGAAAASAGLHAADLHRGPLPDLARHYAYATVELEVTGDPRLSRPRVRGDRSPRPSIVLKADATRVVTTAGAVTTTRTPVMLLAREATPDESVERGAGTRDEVAHGAGSVGAAGHASAARGSSTGPTSWLGLLPSTRLRLSVRLAPPLPDSDRIAAVLRVPEGQPPHIIGQPTALQRTAGKLRAGLREATDDLPADARALLPGLVVGDTSRVPAELQDAFEATDLTHLLAVSGSNLTIVLVLLIGPPGTAARAERRGLAPRLGISLRSTALLGGALTLAFVIVCRPDPSVLRAAACGLIVLLAIGTGRRRSLIPALATAVLVLVLYDPWLARSYGFLLSVLATGALLTLAPRWSRSLRRRRVPPRLAEALAAAAA